MTTTAKAITDNDSKMKQNFIRAESYIDGWIHVHTEPIILIHTMELLFMLQPSSLIHLLKTDHKAEVLFMKMLEYHTILHKSFRI